MRFCLSLKLSPLMLTMIEWCRMRSSIAAVSTLSPAKALSQTAKRLAALALKGSRPYKNIRVIRGKVV